MLTRLHIENYALIENLKIEFEQGLNVITGVTGAGKSIIVGALELTLGGKTSEEMIRSGAPSLAVVASFEIPGKEERLELSEALGIPSFDNVLSIRRDYKRRGGGKLSANGKQITLSALKTISEKLASVLGQHSHQALLDQSSHIGFLDSYGVPEEKSDALRTLYDQTTDLADRISYAKRHAREIAEKIELLSFQIDEIEKANLLPDEEDELKSRKTLLENAGRIRETSDMMNEAIIESDDSVMGKLGSIARTIDELSPDNSTLNEIRGILKSASDTLNEAVSAARNLADGVEDDPAELERINERLHQIFRLKKKYGGSIESILAYAESSRKELTAVRSKIGDSRELEREYEKIRSSLNKAALQISALRQRAKDKLEKILAGNLSRLGMPKARLVVEIETIADEAGIYEKDRQRLRGDSSGFERVEFMFCANPGEELKPLTKIASGGEISRVMLAMKNAFIDMQSGECEIFDEIDVGISGEVAALIAAQLKELAKTHQVICITHLHQIASAAEHHFKVYKQKTGRRSITMVKKLGHEERIKEIAGFLSGKEITGRAIEGAREFLEDSRGKG